MKILKSTILILLIPLVITGFSQPKPTTKTKLMIGIVVDQMRYDYLNRFWNRFGENGFKKLINKGYSYQNTHYNYVPTYTGPGHASIFTGTTPAFHGIIGNNWWDLPSQKSIYCVSDTNFKTVGGSSIEGAKSPQQLLCTTIGDQLKIASNFKSKVIGISLKDRAAILPAGHSANAAYWFESSTGNWISSSFYQNTLPQWVTKVNQLGNAKKYINIDWNTLYPINTYKASIADGNQYEKFFIGEKTSTFPHQLKKLQAKNGNFGILKASPYGNSLTTEIAIACIKGEKMGQLTTTDFLSVSFSATDYIGHKFGPQSIEVEDAYLRLDQEIAKLISALEQEVGESNFTLFLTADHGAVEVPQYLLDHKIPAGYFKDDEYKIFITNELNQKFGNENWISAIQNHQLFLNKELLTIKNKSKIEDFIILKSKSFAGIAIIETAQNILLNGNQNPIYQLIKNGINQKRSGDIVFSLQPNWVSFDNKGTTHGSAYNYDTHVPLIWYGNGISHGKTNRKTTITSIAPTATTLLNVQFPNCVTDEVFLEITEP